MSLRPPSHASRLPPFAVTCCWMRVAADQMHHLGDAGLGIALANDFAQIIPSETFIM